MFPPIVFILSLLFMDDSYGLAPNNAPHILSVGLAAVDFVATVDHFPHADEKMRSSTLLVEGGGNAANTASAMARLKPFVGQSSIVTAVGNDPNGQTILDSLKEINVDTTHIDHYKGNSPFSYILTTDVDGENTRTCIHQPSSAEMSIDFVQKIDLTNVTAVHFDVRHPAAAVALGQRCVKQKIPYSVDVERPREGLAELMAEASVVICSSNYCNLILKDNDDNNNPAKRLRKVMEKQAPKAVIAIQTLGAKGSCLIQLGDAAMGDDCILLKNKDDPDAPVVSIQDGAMFCTAFGGCQVVDTTGAGDAFQGGFLAALWAYASAQDGEIKVPTDSRVLARCLRIGSRVAAKKVEKQGARSGLPLATEDKFIQAEMKAMLKL